jgi:hypothetical protein
MECGAFFDLFNAPPRLSPDEYRSGKLFPTRIGTKISKLCLQGVACYHSLLGTFTSSVTGAATNTSTDKLT